MDAPLTNERRASSPQKVLHRGRVVDGFGHQKKLVAVLPPAGYLVLLLDGAAIVDEIPVICFGLFTNETGIFDVRPLVAEGLYDENSQEYALLRPNGTIEIPFVESFKSREALIAFQQKHPRAGT
jgi:hypothetical protein